MWENVSRDGIKGQIEIHRHIPLISLYFEFLIVLWTDMSPRYPFSEIESIEMVG